MNDLEVSLPFLAVLQDSCKDSFKEVNEATSRAEAGEPSRDDRWLPPCELTGALRNFRPAARRLQTFKATCGRRTKDQLGASEGPQRFLIDSSYCVALREGHQTLLDKKGGLFTAVLFFLIVNVILQKKKKNQRSRDGNVFAAQSICAAKGRRGKGRGLKRPACLFRAAWPITRGDAPGRRGHARLGGFVINTR